LAVAGSAASSLLALYMSPRIALIALAAIAFGRAIALGELLRSLSLFRRISSPVPATANPGGRAIGSLAD
jgi:hypothetical protein